MGSFPLWAPDYMRPIYPLVHLPLEKLNDSLHRHLQNVMGSWCYSGAHEGKDRALCMQTFSPCS